MTQKTYRIEELVTTGWELVEDKHQRLTKEAAKAALDQLIIDVYNPNSLRAIPDGTTT